MAGSPDYGDMISGIMNDPEAMNNVLKIARSLMGTTGAAPTSSSPEPQHEDAVSVGKEDMSEKDSVAASSFSASHGNESAKSNGGDPLASALSILPASLTDRESAANRERLLIALKPYLGEERRGMIDTVLKLLRLVKIADIGKLLDGLK